MILPVKEAEMGQESKKKQQKCCFPWLFFYLVGNCSCPVQQIVRVINE